MLPKNERLCSVISEVNKVIIGKNSCIQLVLMAMLADGHILIEDIPGVGKTTLAVAFSHAMDLNYHRVQFTPDVLPSDVTGFTMYRKETDSFIYQPGQIMCNLFLADEINRTSPKTQSAFLEAMEEGSVTVDGVTRKLPEPFTVIATQNPVGSAGTQLLPESQNDRFMIRIHMGYPDIQDEIKIAKTKTKKDNMNQVNQVMNAAMLKMMQREVENVFIHEELFQYIGRLIKATREHNLIQLGVSPRGTIAVTKMAQASAYLMNRDYIIPEDIETIFAAVTVHRIRMNAKARAAHIGAESVIASILELVPKPLVRKKEMPV